MAVINRVLSVVMPCFNERDTIVEMINRVLKSPYVAELIVVDDGSTDGSAELVMRAVRDDRLTLFRQPHNMGKGAAIRRGLQAVRFEFVVIQDADLEYDPDDYGELLQPLLRDAADVVYGSRFHTSRPHRVFYYWHAVGNRALTAFSNMVTNLNLSDMETCYKVFRREVIQGIAIEEDRFGFEPEVTARVAHGGWRIFEVGISYSGRTYAEGKKIRWKDGLRAVYCICRYGLLGRNAQDDFADEEISEGASDSNLQPVLENLTVGANYQKWIVSMFSEYLGEQILEIGAGRGSYSPLLAEHGHVTALEPSADSFNGLQEKCAQHSRITTIRGDVGAMPATPIFDSVVMLNVLEHIRDDVGVLNQIRSRMCPGAYLIIQVPAMAILYSRFDRMIGHYRRYSKGRLATVVLRAGFEIVEQRYMNSIGALAWWLVARVLGWTPTRRFSVQAYDKMVVPWLKRLERRVPPLVGQSIVLVARKPQI